MCVNFTVVSQARPHKSVNTQLSCLLPARSGNPALCLWQVKEAAGLVVKTAFARKSEDNLTAIVAVFDHGDELSDGALLLLAACCCLLLLATCCCLPPLAAAAACCLLLLAAVVPALATHALSPGTARH